ncbi:TIGR03086 family protein [Microbacteriaceae bacterium VKM Ac-2854]|nr:TIGR03086 family protein [Microbacteriaceae bacterium VKM Ac-2854]
MSQQDTTSRPDQKNDDDVKQHWLALQRRAHDEFGRRVAAVADWSAPTPDAEWDTRALVLHVVREQQWVPPLLRGDTIARAQGRLDPVGSDLAAEWLRHAAAAAAAWADTAADAEVHLSYDTVSAVQYLKEQVSDITIHTWDLARATGTDDTLDPELVQNVWTEFLPQKETLEASGLFALPVPVADDAPLQTRLLALTGRDERWCVA